MVEEIFSSNIITRLGFEADYTNLNLFTDAITKIPQRLRDSLGRFAKVTPLLPDITTPLGPLKDMENQLDGLSGSFRSSSEALVSTNEDFYTLGLASGKTAGDLLNADEATKRTITSMMRYGQQTLVTSKVTNQFGDVISTNTRLMETNIKRFQMWALSIMFFGMQVQRIFGGMWKNMNTAYEKITGNTTALGQANLRLSASMTFLQVSIMTALEPAILPLIEGIIDLVNWFESLPEPIKEVAGLFIIGGVFAGGIMQGLGSIMMFINFGLVPLISQLTGAGGAKEAINSFGLVTSGTATTIGTSFSSIALSLGIAAIAILIAIEMMRGGWEHFENAVKAHTLAIKYASEKNFKEMGIALEIQNKETLAGLEMGWAQFSVDLWNTLLEIGKGILSVEKWLHPESADVINQMIEAITITQTNAYEKLQIVKDQTTANIISDSLREMGTTKEMAQVLVDMGYSYNMVSDAVKGLGISTEDSNAFMKLYTETLATTLRGTTDITSTTYNLTNAISNASKNVLGMDDAQKSLNTTNNLVNVGLNSQIDTFGLYSTAISNVTEQVNGLANAWKVAGTAGVWTFKAGTSEADITKMIGQIQASNTKVGDFIWRAGEGVTQISPNDTVIGTQGGGMGGVSVGDINVSVTTGPISNDIDVKDLANKVSDEIMKDIRNYTKYVPTW